jgi:hypothetical protein
MSPGGVYARLLAPNTSPQSSHLKHSGWNWQSNAVRLCFPRSSPQPAHGFETVFLSPLTGSGGGGLSSLAGIGAFLDAGLRRGTGGKGLAIKGDEGATAADIAFSSRENELRRRMCIISGSPDSNRGTMRVESSLALCICCSENRGGMLMVRMRKLAASPEATSEIDIREHDMHACISKRLFVSECLHVSHVGVGMWCAREVS